MQLKNKKGFFLKLKMKLFFKNLAERGGFEPPVRNLVPTTV